MLRLFTAIPFPEALKAEARNLFRGRLPVAYVNTDNLHITLTFLGDVPDDQLGRVKQVCQEAVPDIARFPIEFDAIVKFHQQLHMTVVETPGLTGLQSVLEVRLRKAGFWSPERQYYPHVKLANLHMDKVMSAHRIENISRDDLKRLDFTVDRIGLFSSKLLMHHAQHTLEAEYPLQETKF